MRLFVFLAILGCALALQAPVEYVYKYEARIGTGVHSSRPTYSGTAIKAKVKVTLQELGVATVKMSEIQVGETKEELLSNGRSPFRGINYQSITDKALELPFKAYIKNRSGETVLEVPQSDLLWVTNIRRGVVNAFRIAPILDPSSVKPGQPGQGESSPVVPPQTISRIEDTYAGRCLVSYTISDAVSSDNIPVVQPDVQSMSGGRAPGGPHVKLADYKYRLISSVDYTSCSDRVEFFQTGAVNLTNVTDSTYRDVSARSFISLYILKGSPGAFRIERAMLESMYMFNPYGIDSEKMVIITNQTLSLVSAVPASRSAEHITSSIKQIKTWQHQVQSPNDRPSQYAPKYVVYKKESGDGPHSPIFYERMVSGFGYPQSKKQQYQSQAFELLKQVSQQLYSQNKEQEQDRVYRGSEDGQAAQRLGYIQKLFRALPYDQLKQLESQIESAGDQCRVCKELYIDMLSVAGSGSSLEVLYEQLTSNKISENRTASLFFHLANNIQSPELLPKLLQWLETKPIMEHPTVASIARLAIANAARRLCVSKQIVPYGSFRYMFGDKMCPTQQIVQKFLQLVTLQPVQGKFWPQIVNIYAVAALGDPSSIPSIVRIAQGHVQNNLFTRIAASHALSAYNFDNSTYPRLISSLLPIAENQREDFRVRQMAYYSILTMRPNATMIQRMAESTIDEPSNQMRTFVFWVLQSLSKTSDPAYWKLSNIAKNLMPIAYYVNPSFRRAADFMSRRYIPEELMGSSFTEAWSTSYSTNFPTELYHKIVGNYGGSSIPLMELDIYGNNQAVWGWISHGLRGMTHQQGQPSLEQQQRVHRTQQQIFENSEVFEPNQQQPDLYGFLRLWRSSEVILPMTDEVTQTFETKVKETLKSLQERQHIEVSHYMNPVEVQMIIPTPPGLFSLTEISTPTVLFAKIDAQVLPQPPFPAPDQLPQVPGVNASFEGLTKVVTKLNTYTIVMAPWTNKTILAAVDTEKSFSLPMKIELSSSVRDPVQSIWGQITPKITDVQQKVPILKARNVPFVTVGEAMSSPVGVSPLKMETPLEVFWLSADQQFQWRKTIPLSQSQIGFNAEISYVAETYYPLVQTNYMEYLQDPSRILNLLVSPSIKSYDLTLYKTPGQSQSKSFGFRMHHLTSHGSGPQITYPESSRAPVNIDVQDSLQQRKQKVAQFSNKENHEIAIMVNFTGGSEPRIYEVSLIRAYDVRNQNSEIKDTFRKYQWTYLQKFPGMSQDQYLPKYALVSVVDRPIPQPLADVLRQFQEGRQTLFDQLSTGIAADVYQGQSLSQQSSVAQCWANFTFSKVHGSNIQGLARSPRSHAIPAVLSRIAVYDQLKLQLKWQSPSRSMKNYTMWAQDLVEGYLFTTVLKNHLASNQERQLIVVANRSISDNRATAFVKLPQFSAVVRGVKVHELFDWVTGYTGEIFTTNEGSILSSKKPGHSCYVDAVKVKTYDSVMYEKKPTTCFSVVTKIAQGDEHILVLAKQMSPSQSSQQEVKILAAKHGIDVTLRGPSVKVSGQEMHERTKEIKDQSGRVVAKILKVQGLSEVELPNKIKVTLKEGKKMQVKLHPRFKHNVRGLCGDYNTDTVQDLSGPQGCIYRPNSGPLFAASWVSKKSECQDEQMKPLIERLSHHSQNCQRSRRLSERNHIYNCPNIQGYPVIGTTDFICYYSDEPSTICEAGCHADKVIRKQVTLYCWSRERAPEELRNGLRQGYIVRPLHTAPEQTYRTTVPVVTNCVPNHLGYPQPPASDSSCLIEVFPVRGDGPLLCVTKEKKRICDSACSSGDTRTHRLESLCWNRQDAPRELKDAEYQGYVRQLPQQQSQIQTLVSFELPPYCYREVQPWSGSAGTRHF